MSLSAEFSPAIDNQVSTAVGDVGTGAANKIWFVAPTLDFVSYFELN